jgi:hypothetical protein
MGIMTTRRLGIALLGLSLTVAVVYVPACEYDPNGKPGQPPTSTRNVVGPQGAVAVSV